MHPRDNKHPSAYVKTRDERLFEKISPISRHLEKTGLDVDDLAAAAGFSKIRLIHLLENAEVPASSECYLLDVAFQFPQGTFFLEYENWSEVKDLS